MVLVRSADESGFGEPFPGRVLLVVGAFQYCRFIMSRVCVALVVPWSLMSFVTEIFEIVACRRRSPISLFSDGELLWD